MPVVRLAGIGKRYGSGGWVLSGIDLDIGPGEVLTVLGSNGSGKSTLLRILVGLSRPTTGTMSGRPDSVGWVPDRFPLHDRMTARAYLTHSGRILGLSGPAAAARAADLTGRLDLRPGPDVPLRTLSRGNAQKVALAQGLLVRPALLVLDEPWTGLDPAAHEVLAEIITAASKAGTAVLFTDHGQAPARLPTTRVYRLESGRLTLGAAPDRPAELLLRPPSGEPATLPDERLLEQSEKDGVLRVLVADAQADALLLAALAKGWSVLDVRRPR